MWTVQVVFEEVLPKAALTGNDVSHVTGSEGFPPFFQFTIVVVQNVVQ